MSCSKIHMEEPAIRLFLQPTFDGLEVAVVTPRRTNMSKRQRKFNETIDELLAICRLRGIGSSHLNSTLHELCTRGVASGTPSFEQEADRAVKLTAAGTSAQLAHLLKAWGIKKLTQHLKSTGGVLDALVRHTSASRAELEEDTGRGNIDADGYIV